MEFIILSNWKFRETL